MGLVFLFDFLADLARTLRGAYDLLDSIHPCVPWLLIGGVIAGVILRFV